MVGILVVDINTTTSFRIKKILDKTNTEIFTATTAHETLNRAISPEKNIDLLIIDVQLGPEDGFELINQLRDLKKNLVICILTGKNTRRDFVKGIRVGATDYILKPFEDEYLRNKLLYHIEAIEMAKSIPNQSPKAIDRAIYNAVRRAIREGYEMMVGLFIIYHTSGEKTVDINLKDVAILKSLTNYLDSNLAFENDFIPYSTSGGVIILPKKRLDEKEEIVSKIELLIKSFLESYKIKDTIILFEAISLPNEVNPKENALTVLARRIEEKVK